MKMKLKELTKYMTVATLVKLYSHQNRYTGFLVYKGSAKSIPDKYLRKKIIAIDNSIGYIDIIVL